MEQTFRTPQELVEGLQERLPGARAQLWRLLREPLKKLMRDLMSRHGLQEDDDLLATHALHSAETGLRARPDGSFVNLSWGAFRAGLIVQMARLATQPHGIASIAGSPAPLPLPDSPVYQCETYIRPHTRLGNHFFGGDWYAGRLHADGSLWVFLADVTGHGYFAYLLASGLPSVWQRCWNAHAMLSPEPAEVLAWMHDQLVECMPEGIFLECTLARLGSDGRATIVPAGATRFFLRTGSKPPELLKLPGAWLGLRAPVASEQRTIKLGSGDEILLCTDGVFDQLDAQGDAEAIVLQDTPVVGLFESVRDQLERSLAKEPQKDDITLVLLRRRHSEDQGVRMLPASSPNSNRGAGDVPV